MHIGQTLQYTNKGEKMKWIIAFLVLIGFVFAGQIVNVGETTEGSTSPPFSGDDSECYTQYFQCLRDGCAAAGGEFNELTRGCYGGSDPKFSEAVGKCANAQGDCIMGTSGETPAYTSGPGEKSEAPICPVGLALLALGGLVLFAQTKLLQNSTT